MLAQDSLYETAAKSAEIAALAEVLKGRGMAADQAYNMARQIILGQAVAAPVPPPTFWETWKLPIMIGGGLLVLGIILRGRG